MGVSEYSEIKSITNYISNSSKCWTDLNQIINMIEMVPHKREYILKNIKNTRDSGYFLTNSITNSVCNTLDYFITIDEIINYIDDEKLFNYNDFYLKILSTIKSGYYLCNNKLLIDGRNRLK